jgi:hypothetical protein
MFENTDMAGRLYGKYPGIVVDNQPPAGADRFQGEIKVKVVPILDEGGQPIEVWAKPCFHPGFFFIPEENDNVWVEFVAGDIDFPIWSGVWYPQGKTPKTVNDEAPVTENKVIRTASGHVVQLDDSDGEERIVIAHKSGATISLDENGSVLIANEKGSFLFLNAEDEEATFMEQHGHLVTMTDQGIVVMNSDGATLELAGDTVRASAKNILLQGTTVGVGANALEPAVLGTTFALMYNTHTHPTAVGPSGPPVPAPKPLGPEPVGQGLSSAVLVK